MPPTPESECRTMPSGSPEWVSPTRGGPMPDQSPDPLPPAIVLLSGGLDSATCLAIARRDGFEPVALSFRYGQRHDVEVEASRRLAERDGVEHVVCEIDLRTFGGSALTA